MLTRRHVRIKVMQSLYSYSNSKDKTLKLHLVFFKNSIKKSFDLYYVLISIFKFVYIKANDNVSFNNQINKDSSDSLERKILTNPFFIYLVHNKSIDKYLKNNIITNWIDDNKYILDLFCGTGTIGQLIAKKAIKNQLIGVDIVNSAIENANENTIKNNLKNVKFICSDVGKFLYEHPEYQDKIDTIVLDPPRAGISPKTLRKVVRLEADRIVYVSCNPATQARDLSTLSEFGYEVIKFSLVDQFPHTGHIESIMLFHKK